MAAKSSITIPPDFVMPKRFKLLTVRWHKLRSYAQFTTSKCASWYRLEQKVSKHSLYTVTFPLRIVRSRAVFNYVPDIYITTRERFFDFMAYLPLDSCFIGSMMATKKRPSQHGTVKQKTP